MRAFIVFLALLFISSNLQAVALDAKQSEFLVIWDAIHSNNERRIIAGLDVLKDYRYTDVADVVIEQAITAINDKKSKKVIEYYIKTIGEITNRSHVHPSNVLQSGESKLLDLRDRLTIWLQSHPSRNTSATKTEFIRYIDEALEAAKLRTEVGSKLFPELSGINAHIISELSTAYKHASLSREALGIEDIKQREALEGYVKFEDQIRGLKKGRQSAGPVKAGDSGPVDILLAGTTKFMTDDVYDKLKDGKYAKILGREDVVERLLMVLSRHRQQNAVLIGSAGAGKTAIVEGFSFGLVTGQYTDNVVTEIFKNATVITTTSGRISRLAKTDKPAGQADAIEAYFSAINEVQKQIDRRVIVFIDEFHTLTEVQIEAIKPFIESTSSKIMLIGASTSPEFRSTFKHNGALLRRVQEVAVREFSEAEILEIFKKSWMPLFKILYADSEINEDVMKLIIRKVGLVFPDKGVLDGSFVFADDLLNHKRYKEGVSRVTLNKTDVYDFVQKEHGLPADPRDAKAMEKYRKDLFEKVSARVLGQERMVNDFVNLWLSVVRNEGKRGVKVGLVLGRSGTGKTETAEVLAELALKSKERVFMIKASQYSDANDIKMSMLLGVPGGVTFGKHTAGRLMDWLDDPAKGKFGGIIIIDEVEKANLLFFESLMEMFDKGIVEGGDNKIRRLNKHMIVLTSNEGAHTIFPDDVVKWTEEQINKRLIEMTTAELRKLFENKVPDYIINRMDVVSVSSVLPMKISTEILSRAIDAIRVEMLESSGLKLEVDARLIEDFLRAENPLLRGVRPSLNAVDAYIKGAVQKITGNAEYAPGDTIFLTRTTSSEGFIAIEASLNNHKELADMPHMEMDATSCKSLF